MRVVKSTGKYWSLDFEVLERFGKLTLLSYWQKTGRRCSVHALTLAHPLLSESVTLKALLPKF